MIWSNPGLSKKGFTLIELIVFIIVGAIILPASFIAFTAAIQHFSTPDYYVKARFFAEQKVEEITKDVFGTYSTGQPYTPILGYTDYQWKWDICYTGSSEINLECSIAHNTFLPDYNYYQRIEVTVLTPDNSTYGVYTLITKRPKS